MTKYAIFFSYSSDSWARMIGVPGDRTAAVRQVLSSMGGSLECIYWMHDGFSDGLVIADLPDAVSAAAASIAVTSTGAITRSEAHELLTQEQLGQALRQAGATVRAFQPPGRET